MAKYLVLIYGDESGWATMSEQERAEIDGGHRALWTRAGTAVLAHGQLESPAMATTLRGAGVTDGPFLETKEIVGGFYLLEAADLDEVISLANLLAETRHGHSGVEITPLVGS
ncbi:YciI family protein [Longispora sp. K20-0274]|uniref:YciI family protein n=1 Tax=Longispora sp. K20-0274 TaxID=3088255 RepID=UPI00399BF2FC